MGVDITAEIFIGKNSEDYEEIEAWEEDEQFHSLEKQSDWSGEWNMIGISIACTNPFTPEELSLEEFLQNLTEATVKFKKVFPNETPRVYLIPHMS